LSAVKCPVAPAVLQIGGEPDSIAISLQKKHHFFLPTEKMVVVSKMGTKSQNSMARSDYNDHI
jgi:hypothetical protein